MTRVEDPSKYGVVVTDGEGKVERFVEKPQARAGTLLACVPARLPACLPACFARLTVELIAVGCSGPAFHAAVSPP